MEEACLKWSPRLSVEVVLCLLAIWLSGSQAKNLSHPLRFWIDEYAFSGGETTILREKIEEAGSSIAVLVGETRSNFLSLKGFYAPEQWDVYWTGRQGCIQALPYAVPGHKISCVPGLHELTIKDRLVARLTQFYGEGAFRIIPRSYLLPTQYWQWRLWLAAQGGEAQRDMWVLKEERHRGTGVHVMPLKDAKEKAKVRRVGGNYDLAQAYIAKQMTVVGRKFYVRLWAVVTSSFPLRAYLFNGGVVVFGNTTPDDKKQLTSDDFIVNLWHLGRTTEAAPWSVAEFRTYVDNLTGSRTAFDTLWRQMQESLGLTFAAGVQAMRFNAASFPVAAASATFELVGIDFLVDEDMKPWLLEVNAVPSLARKVINCEKQPAGCTSDGEAESVFDIEKEKLVHSLFNVLRATAGTQLQANTSSPGAPKPLTLAEFLTRWRSNTTDLAALNATNHSEHKTLLSDLGWKADHKPVDDTSGMSLSNSGRELKTSKEQEEGTGAVSRGSAPGESVPAATTFGAAEDRRDPPVPVGGAAPFIHHVARSRSVADASNLNKYVPEAERTTPKRRPEGEPGEHESHDQILEEHLLETSVEEIKVALENQFLPLMMVPEAAAYSALHQTRREHLRARLRAAAADMKIQNFAVLLRQYYQHRLTSRASEQSQTQMRLYFRCPSRLAQCCINSITRSVERGNSSFGTRRGSIFPQPRDRRRDHPGEGLPSWMRFALLPFKPVVSAYGGLGQILERLRLGLMGILPDINFEVTMGVSSVIPGTDWLFMQGYKLFSWGDRRGTVEAISVLPQHKLDQKLAAYVRGLAKL